MKKKNKSEVKLTGSKKDGWYIHISDDQGYKEDFVLTHEELILIYNLITKKLKK